MFWPHPLRHALLISDSEPPSPASYTLAVVDGASTPPPAVSHHVAVDIPDGDHGDDSDDYELETTPLYISPVCRVLVKAAFVGFTGFAAPALVTTAITRSTNFLQALPILMLVALAVVSLYMAALRVFQYEDSEMEEEEGDDLETSIGG